MKRKGQGIIETLCILTILILAPIITIVGLQALGKTSLDKKVTDNTQIVESLVKPSYDYLKSVTVYITGRAIERKEGTENPKISGWRGTGVVIKVKKEINLEDNIIEEYTYILTNAHIAGKDKTNVNLFIGKDFTAIEAEVVKFHDFLDLAVIKVRGKLPKKRAIKGISFASPQDRIFLVGHHLGRPYLYGEGVFAGYQGIYDIVQIPTLFGNSGSGVFNKDGKLVGLIFAINAVNYFSYDVAHGLAISGISIELFLKKLNLY